MKKIIILLVMTAFAAGYVFGGVEWTTSIKTTGKSKRENNEIVAHTYAQGGNVKQVFESVSQKNMFYLEDGFWLYKANEENIYIVNNKEKTFMVMNMDSLLQLTGAMGKLVKITISDHTIDTEVLPEETLLGFPCNHIKITSDYTMKMKITIIKKTSIIHEEKEIWASTGVPGLQELHAGFLNKNYKTGIPDLDELIKKEMEKQKAIGFPLKMITHTVSEGKKGKVESETVTTMTVNDIKEKDIPASFFEIPAGYKEVEGPASGKGIF